MWPYLTVLTSLLLVVIHLIWRRRCRNLEERLRQASRRELALEERQQRGLAEVTTRQQAVFNSMVEGLMLLDHAGRIQLVNPALERWFNLTGDIRGQTVIEATRLLSLQDVVDRTRELGQVVNSEIDLPGGSPRVLAVNASALPDGREGSGGMILVFHDLTRLKQLENARKEFVANVSHELRTPLSMIKGYVETLLDGAKADPEVATRFLQTIRKHTDRLAFLIEDLLAISQLESGRTALNLHQFRLHSLVEEVFGDLRTRAMEKQISLENQVPDLLELRADPGRIQQVLFNLVDNAIKYGRYDGFVRIHAEPSAGGVIRISVQDNGAGVPPEARERVFERFYRADRARSREQGGTGLGLAIVKHIVQFHGGEVWIESQSGQGTTFFFTLPSPERETDVDADGGDADASASDGPATG